jgi:hypothetical protein
MNPKYINPPEPDRIKTEIEYLKDKMLVLPFKVTWNPRSLDLKDCLENN